MILAFFLNFDSLTQIRLEEIKNRDLWNHRISRLQVLTFPPSLTKHVFFQYILKITSTKYYFFHFFSGGSGGKKGQKGHGGKGSNKSKRKAPDELWNEGQAPTLQNPLTPFLVEKLPTSTNLDDPSLEVLCLLRALHALNRYWGSLFEGMF